MKRCYSGNVLGAILLVAMSTVYAAESCSTRSAVSVPTVIELYTSEGCNSCPPADQWLSRLKSDPGIVALAFHVDYWDRLGWKDRFASPAFTQRQERESARNGADYGYTPQVVLDGVDNKRWYQESFPLSRHEVSKSVVDVKLTGDGNVFTATITPTANAPAHLAAYWAVTEHNHQSAVKAGENAGATLKHDFVVREYQPIATWNAKSGVAETLQFTAKTRGDTAHPRQVNLVVTDAKSGRPVQAIKIGC
ncbi:MAG TPA: DUF1223 domain-containing protein [Steroidobacteraceae bacterium]|nr:DUF1223 domain-containing protein [Steroidobacteraceae bacterium]